MLLHDVLRRRVEEAIFAARELDGDVVKLSAELATFCWEWMLNHILTEDKKYTKCFNEHGLY
jgi:hemerythrin